MDWPQVYNPAKSWIDSLGLSVAVSTALAALPVAVLLGLLGIRGWPAPRAALAGLVSSLLIAIGFYDMPVDAALASAAHGAAFGLFPIGWIVLAAIFLYSLTVETGQFEVVKNSVAALSADRRVQAVIIAFSFGAFLEGAAGFGTPVAISAALLIGAGFPALQAAGLSLIANTAPVAFGALGTPITTLAKVTGLPEMELSAMAGRQLPFFSLLIPAWMVWVMAGWRGLLGIWPAILVAGGSFAGLQFLVSNWVGPSLVDVTGGLASLVLLALFLRFWKPSRLWTFPGEKPGAARDHPEIPAGPTRRQIISAWVPWILLSLCVFLWGLPPLRTFLDGGLPGPALRERLSAGATGGGPRWWELPNGLTGWSVLAVEVPWLHNRVYRVPPVVAKREKPEEAIFRLNWLSATGSGILIASILSALWMRISPKAYLTIFWRTLLRMRWPLVTIAAMMAIAYITRYSGIDATLGLAFTRTGAAYPFFAAMLGWLGVALTGSDTSSNALFGSLQKITAEQLGLSPILICASNSTGGVMGKMIDAQSIVVSAAATEQPGREGPILRFVFWHSLVLAALMGLLTVLQAYVFPWMVPP